MVDFIQSLYIKINISHINDSICQQLIMGTIRWIPNGIHGTYYSVFSMLAYYEA